MWCVIDGAWCVIDGVWCVIDGLRCVIDVPHTKLSTDYLYLTLTPSITHQLPAGRAAPGELAVPAS